MSRCYRRSAPDQAIRRQHPDRYAKLEAIRKAALAADRALSGVIRYIEQEAAELPPRTGVLVEAKKQPPPNDPERSQRIRSAVEEAVTKVEPVFKESQAAELSDKRSTRSLIRATWLYVNQPRFYF